MEVRETELKSFFQERITALKQKQTTRESKIKIKLLDKINDMEMQIFDLKEDQFRKEAEA